MIHVCFVLHDKTGLFSKFTGTAILSLLENTNAPSRSMTVHILHDDTLAQDNREKFIGIAERYGQLVKFYNVEELCADKIKEIKMLLARAVNLRFSIAAFYKLFIADILAADIKKIIYLDADIIVNLDIAELWQIDLGEKILGAVTISSQKAKRLESDYFNSGVMLINIPAFRVAEKNLESAIKFFSENPQYEGTDQQILNRCFANQILKLPLKFNRLVKNSRRRKETQAGEMIYHFNSHLSRKGLGLDMNDPFNRLWMSYFVRTPFFDLNSIGRLYNGILEVRNDLNTSIAKISAMVSGKTRAFFVAPAQIELMKQFFAIRPDELIIPAENEESLKKLIDAMKTFKGKCVFFIMTKKFLGKDFPVSLLIKEKFVGGKDFVRAWRFLTEEYGFPFNSNPLIQAL